MNTYRVPSPFGGPDAVVQMPTKPVRLQLEPGEALTLFICLEQFIEVLDATPDKPPAALIGALDDIHSKLLDRLEVCWEEKPSRKRGK